MESNQEKKRRKATTIEKIMGALVIAGGISSIMLALSVNILGFAKEPVFFKDGKIVQLVDNRAPLVVEKSITKTVVPVVDQEKEILKIAYCLQSLQPKLSIEVAQIIAKHTYKECTEKKIVIPMWIALMFAESSLDPMKSSNAGAHGLCQVRYATWKEQPELLENGVSVKDKLFWIDLNIKSGTAIFRKYYDESGGKVGVALWRYNSGQTKLPDNKRAYDIEYVAKIMYYQYKVMEILSRENSGLHTVSDPEVLAENTPAPAALVPEIKEKAKKPTKHD